MKAVFVEVKTLPQTIIITSCPSPLVVNRRHVYTHWEGDPAAAVEKSKHASTRSSTSVFSTPPSSLPTTPSPTHCSDNSTSDTGPASASKSKREESHGDPKSDDSVFERESPCVEKESGALGLNVGEEVGEKQAVEETGVSGGVREVEEERVEKERGEKPDSISGGGSSGVSQYPDKEEDSSPGTKVAGVNPHVTQESSLDSHQDSTPSSLPTSSSSPASFNTTPAISGSNLPAISAGDSPTKPPAPTASASHKSSSRQPFSRKFAAPIVVTHTRRTFPKSLPKNLDPKSTVTLLLSSSPSSSSTSFSEKAQQKKHTNKSHKSFNTRRQFPSSYHPSSLSKMTGAEGDQEESVTSRDSSISSPSSSSTPLTLRLKGREKERELWRKRFSSSSLPSSELSNGVGEHGARRGSVSGEGEEEGGGGERVKRSPAEMSAIQSRVRASLKAQGVVSPIHAPSQFVAVIPYQ